MKIKNGNVQADVKGATFAEQLLRTVAPDAARIIEDAFDEIYTNAKQQWPVRKKGRSRGSKNKLRKGIRITSTGQLSAYLENTAEYAWAIKVGVDTDTYLPLGKRVADELLWRPAKKQTKPIMDAVAKDIVKRLK